jgi:hypothetical protein
LHILLPYGHYTSHIRILQVVFSSRLHQINGNPGV